MDINIIIRTQFFLYGRKSSYPVKNDGFTLKSDGI